MRERSASEPEPGSGEASLRDYLDLMSRRRGVIALVFVLVMLPGVVWAWLARPQYRATCRILVEGRAVAVTQVNGSNPLNDLFSPDAGHDVLTQIEVLQSARLLVEACHAAGVPLTSVKVDVHQVNATDVIEISVESTSPRRAEDMARQIPLTYRQYVTGNRKNEIAGALAFARRRWTEENARLARAEADLRQFKQQARLTDLAEDRTQSLLGQTETRAAHDRVETQAQGAAARLAALVAARTAQPPTLDRPVVATNPQIAVVQEQLARAKTEQARLLVLMKPSRPGLPADPQMQEVEAQIADAQQRLQTLPATVTTQTRIVNPLISDLDGKIAEARASLADAHSAQSVALTHLETASSRLPRFSLLEQQLSRLQRERERHQAALTALTGDVEELSLRDKMTHDPLTLIAPAQPALQVGPQRALNVFYAALTGLLLGMAFALLQEFLDDRIHTPEQARLALNAPLLGCVPRMTEPNETERLLSLAQTDGAALESYRVLRSNVQFAGVDAPVRSLLVTSTLPGEGKSLTAANLAIAFALDERRVILVDADLRRPSLIGKFNLKLRSEAGLTGVLVGQAALEEALCTTDTPNLRLLPSGSLPPNPAELLNSQAMRRLHAQLRELADIVIFDSPPCLATADAQILAAQSDGVLYVMQFGRVKRAAVVHARELLAQTRVRVLGFVGNKINVSQPGSHPYYLHDDRPKSGRGGSTSEQATYAVVTPRTAPTTTRKETEDA